MTDNISSASRLLRPSSLVACDMTHDSFSFMWRFVMGYCEHFRAVASELRHREGSLLEGPFEKPVERHFLNAGQKHFPKD